jgi:hypothetical protein
MSGPLATIVQIAYLVDDVQAAALQWADRTGAGPFFVRRHPPLASVEHRGASALFDHSSAFGQWGSVQVELVQLHDAAPGSLALALGGSPGIHHVACFVHSLEAEQQRLEALGWPALLTARTAGGLTFGFHDSRADLGHLVEVYEPSDRLLRFYAKVAQAASGWDGSDPVRSA